MQKFKYLLILIFILKYQFGKGQNFNVFAQIDTIINTKIQIEEDAVNAFSYENNNIWICISENILHERLKLIKYSIPKKVFDTVYLNFPDYPLRVKTMIPDHIVINEKYLVAAYSNQIAISKELDKVILYLNVIRVYHLCTPI